MHKRIETLIDKAVAHSHIETRGLIVEMVQIFLASGDINTLKEDVAAWYADYSDDKLLQDLFS